MIKNNIIAITGIAGSGKETFAKMLKLALFNKCYGTREGAYKVPYDKYYTIKDNFDTVDIVHFSTPLKEIAAILEGVDVCVYSDRETKEAHRPFVIRLGDVLKQINPAILLDVTLRKIQNPSKFYIIEDLRLPIEEDLLKSKNVTIIKVKRSGVTLVNDHITETNIDNISANIIIQNNGTFEDLYKEAESIANLIEIDFHLN